MEIRAFVIVLKMQEMVYAYDRFLQRRRKAEASEEQSLCGAFGKFVWIS
jgi:hypothetical protein